MLGLPQHKYGHSQLEPPHLGTTMIPQWTSIFSSRRNLERYSGRTSEAPILPIDVVNVVLQWLRHEVELSYSTEPGSTVTLDDAAYTSFLPKTYTLYSCLCSCSLVARTWSAAATNTLYSNVQVSCLSQLKLLSRTFSRSPALADFVKTLSVEFTSLSHVFLIEDNTRVLIRRRPAHIESSNIIVGNRLEEINTAVELHLSTVIHSCRNVEDVSLRLPTARAASCIGHDPSPKDTNFATSRSMASSPPIH